MENFVNNILDINRCQLLEEHQSVVTLKKARSKVAQKPPEEADGKLSEKELLTHRKSLKVRPSHSGSRSI